MSKVSLRELVNGSHIRMAMYNDFGLNDNEKAVCEQMFYRAHFRNSDASVGDKTFLTNARKLLDDEMKKLAPLSNS